MCVCKKMCYDDALLPLPGSSKVELEARIRLAIIWEESTSLRQ